MSLWTELNIADKITQILSDVPNASPEHHMGRPFLTAYQIAIEFATRYPDETMQIGDQIGEIGVGQRNSLTQYLAQQLSMNIKSKRLPHIEAGFLSTQHLNEVSFRTGIGVIRPSLAGLSLFRLSN
jgi:hypothetical protein